MEKRRWRVVNGRTGQIVLTDLRAAGGPWASLKGLMFDAALPAGEGLLFEPARGIHTQFMRFPIDLVFLDRERRVVKIRERMVPWRLDFSAAAGVIEANAGAARATCLAVGDPLRFEPVEP